MIVVDQVRRAKTPWRGGAYSHMTSDASVQELLDFAAQLGLRLAWFQYPPRASHPHFDITPGLRDRAIAAGAQAVESREYVAAVRRLRARETAAQLAREARP